MPNVFFRLHTDKTEQAMPLEEMCAGPNASACWLIGGGPSLSRLPWDAINSSPIPKMCINLSGSRLVRPNYWTSYDPSVRFHRSIYLDPSIMKFVHRRRAMDLVPETSFKVCECPNTYFFERDADRKFSDLLSPNHQGIVDWADSLMQSIDILYRLGFRRLFLIGCEMRINPSPAWKRAAAKAGVTYEKEQLLRDFYRKCRDAQMSDKEIERCGSARQYHFDERKPVRAAVNTDGHYFRIAQFLRLCRRSLSLAGMQIISATNQSRLNDYFTYQSASKICRSLLNEIGNPSTEPTRGMYTQTVSRQNPLQGAMRDFLPPKRKIAPRQSPKRGEAYPLPAPEELLVEEEGYQPIAACGWHVGEQKNGQPTNNGRDRFEVGMDEIEEEG